MFLLRKIVYLGGFISKYHEGTTYIDVHYPHENLGNWNISNLSAQLALMMED